VAGLVVRFARQAGIRRCTIRVFAAFGSNRRGPESGPSAQSLFPDATGWAEVGLSGSSDPVRRSCAARLGSCGPIRCCKRLVLARPVRRWPSEADNADRFTANLWPASSNRHAVRVIVRPRRALRTALDSDHEKPCS
jgi:hypothetical protein